MVHENSTLSGCNSSVNACAIIFYHVNSTIWHTRPYYHLRILCQRAYRKQAPENSVNYGVAHLAFLCWFCFCYASKSNKMIGWIVYKSGLSWRFEMHLKCLDERTRFVNKTIRSYTPLINSVLLCQKNFTCLSDNNLWFFSQFCISWALLLIQWVLSSWYFGNYRICIKSHYLSMQESYIRQKSCEPHFQWNTHIFFY